VLSWRHLSEASGYQGFVSLGLMGFTFITLPNIPFLEASGLWTFDLHRFFLCHKTFPLNVELVKSQSGSSENLYYSSLKLHTLEVFTTTYSLVPEC
jgi:hypothetical protein